MNARRFIVGALCGIYFAIPSITLGTWLATHVAEPWRMILMWIPYGLMILAWGIVIAFHRRRPRTGTGPADASHLDRGVRP